MPLKIKFSDFGVTNDADIDTVSLWEKEIVLENKGLYGTAKVIMNDTEGKYVLYTLDKPLDKNITIPLYVKFSQKGDNDKPQLFTANIIPATNVYYEDSFAKFYGSDGIQQTQFTATGTGDTPGVWYISRTRNRPPTKPSKRLAKRRTTMSTATTLRIRIAPCSPWAARAR